MVKYSKEEIVGVTEFGKSIGAYLDKVIANPLNKLVLVRRNKPEAVIVPIEEYEFMKELSQFQELREIYDVIQERVVNRKTPAKFLTTDELLEKLREVGKNV